MWAILAEAVLWTTFYVINRYLRADPPQPKPNNDLQSTPRTEEGIPLPLIFGKVRVDSAVLAWRGPLENTAATVSGTQVYTYYIDLFFVLGLPVPYDTSGTVQPCKLHRLFLDDQQTTWVALTSSTTGGPSDTALTGGQVATFSLQRNDRSFNGSISFYDGYQMRTNSVTAGLGTYHIGTGSKVTQKLNSNTSTSDPQLTTIARAVTRAGDDLTLWPSYKSMLSVAICGVTESYGFNIGSTPSLPSFGFEVSSLGAVNYSTPGDFGSDMCPVDVIANLLTDTWARLGLPTSRIDSVSFTAAATTLKTEQNGYSHVIYDRGDVSQPIQNILDQIDASLYVEPTTNQYKIKLIRQDYVVASLTTFSDTLKNIIDVTDYGLGAWRETYNKVEVRFLSRDAGYAQGTAVAHNLANAAGQDGTFRSMVIDLPGVKTSTTATKIAARELNVVSQPLSKITIVVNRDAINLRPGDAFVVTYAEYGIDTVFRCTRIDFGQLYDNKVTINGVQDVWDSTGSGVFFGTIMDWPVPYPMRDRYLAEAPRWLQLLATNKGTIPSPDAQHDFAVGIPDYNATSFSVRSFEGNSNPAFVNPYSPDVHGPSQQPNRATLAVAYSRTLDPYDTSTGVVIENCAGPYFSLFDFSAFTATNGQITANGRNMFVIITDGHAEFMCFESATSIGGGQYRLNNVWRGLMDQPAIDHAIGDLVFFVNTDEQIGHMVFQYGSVIDYQFVPRGAYGSGSGGDPEESHDVTGRFIQPLPPSDVRISSESPIVAGTLGIPSVVGHYKRITVMEEGITVYGNRRERTKAAITRGDVANDTMTEIVIYTIVARKAAGDNAAVLTAADGGFSQVEDGANSTTLDGTDTNVSLVRLGIAGHGEIDVGVSPSVDTGSTSPANDALIYQYDLANIPHVRVTAPRWRNLMSNGRFATGSSVKWTTDSGSILVSGTTSSLRRVATDYFAMSNALEGTSVFEEVVNISGYLPTGLRATLAFYYRNMNADANDTIRVDFAELDKNGVVVNTQTMAAVAGSLTVWTKQKLTFTVVDGATVSLRVKVTFTGVADASPDSAISTCSVRVGQFVEDQLANGTFEAGTFTSWTNFSNSFVANTTVPMVSATAAQGGAFASSEIRQTVALPAGYQYGTAVLRLFRLTSIASDTGNVIMESLDAGSVVLSTVSTGVETTTPINVWFDRILTLDLPYNATQVRVRLLANRAAGAGNSGACFDDADLMFHKQLDGSLVAPWTFTTPTAQAMPETWQQFYLDHTSLAAPAPLVFGGDAVYLPGELVWNDGAVHQSAKGMGWWDVSTRQMSVNAYQFARQSGGTATCIVATGDQITSLASFSSTSSFTVMVWFKVDEIGFATACGLTGRMDGTTGWQMGIDATGSLFAQLKGLSGTKTATRTGVNVADGAWHLAAMSYDASLATLTIYDELGSDFTSTAAGLGEFSNVGSTTCTYRIGRGVTTDNTLPGMIARVYIDQLRTSAEIASMWTYLGDPTGGYISVSSDYTGRTNPLWVPGIPNSEGATLVCVAANQLAIGYASGLTLDGGNGCGLVLTKNHTNIIQSFDLTNTTYWVTNGTATVTAGVADPTGKTAGVAVHTSATDALKTLLVPMTATATMAVVFWARAVGGANLTVDLLNSADVQKQTINVNVTETWAQYTVNFTLWDNSTATSRIRWKSQAGTDDFDMCHVVWACQGTDVPYGFPFATKASGSGYVEQQNVAFTEQLNYEGEMDVVGICATATPSTGVIACATNLVDNKNKRTLYTTAGTPKCDHYDATVPTNTTSTGTAINWTAMWRCRQRWNVSSMPDGVANAYAGLVTTGSANSSVYGRAATFSASTTTCSLFLGYDGSTSQVNAIIRSCRFAQREQKI